MADFDSADILQAQLEGAKQWPVPWEHEVRKKVRTYRALFHSERAELKQAVDWSKDYEYICDPLPFRISNAFADLIFGEDPVFKAADENDQDYMDEFVESNDLPSELQRAAAIASSEGEVWWRLFIDTTQSLYPIIEFHSRLNVVPLLRGRNTMAAAFVSEVKTKEPQNEGGDPEVIRYVELQAQGVTRNLMYSGTSGDLGSEISLESDPDYEDLDEEWAHELDMLCGRIVNGYGSSYNVGKSDYEGISDLLFALNEAVSIGHANARLTARRRVIIPDSYLDAQGRPPLEDDVIIRSEAHKDPDKPDAGMAQLEWSFDAEPLLAYISNLVSTAISRVGLTRHFADAGNEEGTADSGTSLRLKMLPASITADGKARWWDDGLPKITSLAGQLDALALGDGGQGRDWADPAELPSVERTDPIPRDPTEDATMVMTLRNVNLISLETSMDILHPDWTPDQKEDELQRLKDEQAEQAAQFAQNGPEVPTPDLEGGGFEDQVDQEPPEVDIGETS